MGASLRQATVSLATNTDWRMGDSLRQASLSLATGTIRIVNGFERQWTALWWDLYCRIMGATVLMGGSESHCNDRLACG